MGANGRSLLVRVPLADRFVVDPAAPFVAEPVPVDSAFAGSATGVGAGLLAALSVEPAPAGDFLVLARVWPAVVPAFAVRAFVVLAFVVPVAAEGVDRFRAGLGSLVDFCGLMDQRYAVFPALRESVPGPCVLRRACAGQSRFRPRVGPVR